MIYNYAHFDYVMETDDQNTFWESKGLPDSEWSNLPSSKLTPIQEYTPKNEQMNRMLITVWVHVQYSICVLATKAAMERMGKWEERKKKNDRKDGKEMEGKTN